MNENNYKTLTKELGNDENITIGLFMKEQRVARGLTLARVAEELNISVNYVSQLERGNKEYTDDLIVMFSKLYENDENEVFWRFGKIPPEIRCFIIENKNLQASLTDLYYKEKFPQNKSNEEQTITDRLIAALKEYKAEDMMYNFSIDDKTLQNNLDAIRRIRKYNLPNEVINVLAYISLQHCENYLSIEFMEKVAKTWLSKRIKTAEEAMEISKSHIKVYEEWVASIKDELEKKETNKLELTNLNAIRIAADNSGISDEGLGMFVREILKS